MGQTGLAGRGEHPHLVVARLLVRLREDQRRHDQVDPVLPGQDATRVDQIGYLVAAAKAGDLRPHHDLRPTSSGSGSTAEILVVQRGHAGLERRLVPIVDQLADVDFGGHAHHPDLGLGVRREPETAGSKGQNHRQQLPVHGHPSATGPPRETGFPGVVDHAGEPRHQEREPPQPGHGRQLHDRRPSVLGVGVGAESTGR